MESIAFHSSFQLPDLVLNGINSSDISGITESFTQLKKLEIVNCALKSVSGLPSLPSLKTVSQDVIIHKLIVIDLIVIVLLL